MAVWCVQVALAEGSGEAQALMSAEMRSQVVRLVLAKTTGRFHELAREVVATVRSLPLPLRRLAPLRACVPLPGYRCKEGISKRDYSSGASVQAWWCISG